MSSSWDKLETESAKAYQAFSTYLQLGYKRTHEKVRIKLELKSSRVIEEWSRKNNWVARANDFDQYMISLAINESRNEISEIVNNYLKVLKFPTIAFIKNGNKYSKDMGSLTVKELFSIIIQSARVIPQLAEVQESYLGRLNKDATMNEDDDLQDLLNNPQVRSLIEAFSEDGIEANGKLLSGNAGEVIE